MKRLVFRGRAPRPPGRPPLAEEVVVVLGEEEAAPSERTWRVAEDYLDDAARDAADEAAMAWTKAWGARPLLDGRSFRELYAWKGVSLWWFAELYLHHCTDSPRHLRLIETLQRILAAERPEEVEAVGLPTAEAVLLGRLCAQRGILFHGPRAAPGWPSRARVLRLSLEGRLNTFKTAATALKSALAGPPPEAPAEPGRKTVLFLSHAAFWRERREGPGEETAHAYEHYFDRLIPQAAADPGLRPFVVAVGPRSAFRRRGLGDRLSEWLSLPQPSGPYAHVNRYTSWRVLRETMRATRGMREAWTRLRRSPAVREAFSHQGVTFSDLAEPGLAGILLLQLPWAVRCYEEMAAVLQAVRPQVACLYAESSGWGRAALAACRAGAVPTVAVQHGILYPKYYSYRHGPDEADCPRPDRTAVFGESARRLLQELGHYPPAGLVATGSPKFDDLLEGARLRERPELRARLGARDGEVLLAVASRYRPIRRTHQAIGSALPGLFRAVDALPGVRALVKPHPAEPSAPYEAEVRRAGTARVDVLPPATDLLELLVAADALVTVESLSAVEALVLGRPVLVLNMPTHLKELVDRGVALGVPAGADPAPALRDLLFDPATRAELARARERYLSDLALGVDGKASERILRLLKETAAGGSVLG